jgi:hypothetical protein
MGRAAAMLVYDRVPHSRGRGRDTAQVAGCENTELNHKLRLVARAHRPVRRSAAARGHTVSPPSCSMRLAVDYPNHVGPGLS